MTPEIVVWVYYEGNDIEDLNREEKSPTLMRYLNGDIFQGLIDKQQIIDRVLIDYEKKAMEREERHEENGISLLYKFKNIVKLSKLRERLGAVGIISNPPPPLFRKIIERANDMISSWNGRMYFVYLPTFERYTRHLGSRNLYNRDQVLSIIRELDISIIDISNVFSQQKDPISLFQFRTQGHYTAEGYNLVAQEILNCLNDTGPDLDQHCHVREYSKDYFARLNNVGFQPIPEWEAVMAARRRFRKIL